MQELYLKKNVILFLSGRRVDCAGLLTENTISPTLSILFRFSESALIPGENPRSFVPQDDTHN